MRFLATTSFRGVCAASLSLSLVLAGAASEAVAEEQASYAVVHGWPRLPTGRILGQATGVGIDSKGDVHAFHRAGRVWTEPLPLTVIDDDTIAVFDSESGAQVKAWGRGLFAMPHGLTIDREDNVWVTDVALHQVFKFDKTGKLLLTLGTRGVAGDDKVRFNRPTDVAIAEDGSVFVADGYRNSRIVKFSADGMYLEQWGKKGSGNGQFRVPHALALDAHGNIYVADRGNARVQIFSPQGDYVSQWSGPKLGRPYSVAVKGEEAVVVDGGDQPASGPDRAGAVMLDLSGQVLAAFGTFGNYDGQFRLAHDVAFGRDGSVYVVDAWGQRLQKFSKIQDRKN